MCQRTFYFLLANFERLKSVDVRSLAIKLFYDKRMLAIPKELGTPFMAPEICY